ncbi:lactonase family protein [Paenibacillus wynnii]|uniref:lactonase family protein n=1 Tax=Paenibacillus wynnii TaxID=268407 RepID=UPI002791EDDE|nr:lactonase family protein [Paenibacillus wynnii]MDQ0196189.1 6-phosphogluconolactonase [Paenibacillus wynnii]
MERSDQVLFYVGTYSSEEKESLFLCALNLDGGEMRILAGTKGIENPSYLALNEAGTILYAVSEKDAGEIHAYSVDHDTKALISLGGRSTGGGSPCYVSISQKEDYVFVSNYSGGNVNVFPVNSDGSLQKMSSQVRHTGQGIREDRQDAPHPHSIIPDSSGERVMVCDLGLDQIIFYSMEGGLLTTHREVNLPPGSGPRHLALHPSGKWVYVVNELNNTVTVFTNDDTFGNLNILQHIPTLPEHYIAGSDDTAADIHISSCGRFLYASNRGHDSIVLFTIDDSSGLLTASDWQTSGGRDPRNFAIFNNIMLVANQNSSTITSYTIDADNGRLIPTGNELGVSAPVCIKFL